MPSIAKKLSAVLLFIFPMFSIRYIINVDYCTEFFVLLVVEIICRMVVKLTSVVLLLYS